MARRPNLFGRLSSRPSVGTRIDSLVRLADLSPTDRRRLERVIEEVGRIDAIDVSDVLVVAEPRPQPVVPKLTAQLVSEALTDAKVSEHQNTQTQLHQVTEGAVNFLRKKEPDAFPKVAVEVGKNGPSIPLASRSLEQLLRFAAKDRSEGQDSVIWDDGVNQLVVHIGRIRSTITAGRIRVDIPIEADGLRETMSVPFAVGSKKNVAGTVMATADRPAGHALVARIWGNALIALAHASIIDASESVAGAVGVDERNQRLVPGVLTATRGRLTIDSVAGHKSIKEGRR